MYTSPDKLAETIAFQQRLLRQAMVEQANMLKQPNNIDKKKSREASEWKVCIFGLFQKIWQFLNL